MIKKIVHNHINCKKCGVKLIEKNSRLSTYDKDSGLYFVRSTCNYCARKVKYCVLKYEDPELEKLAAKQAKVLHCKNYYRKVIKPKRDAVKVPYEAPKFCIQCNIELCEKNEQIILSNVNNRGSKCKTCTHGYNSCKVFYPTKELQELSKINNKKLNLKLNKIRHPEMYREALKNSLAKNKDKYLITAKFYADKQRNELGDNYVKQRIVSSGKLKTKEVTPRLIEIKRKQLELIRTLNQIQNEQNKHKTDQRCC
jgi:hypothetical protein